MIKSVSVAQVMAEVRRAAEGFCAVLAHFLVDAFHIVAVITLALVTVVYHELIRERISHT